MDHESREAPVRHGRLAESGSNGNGRALTVLLTVICSLIALTPFVWVVVNTITDLKIQLQACREGCETEKLRIIVDRALVDIEDLGADADTAALQAIADRLRYIQESQETKPKP